MNPTRRVFFRSSFLVIWAVAMTTVTVVLGAPPLRILRLVMGRLLFFAIALGLSLVLFGVGWKPLAILFLLLTALVGVYSELLDRKWHPISSAAIAVSLSCIFGILGFGLWTLRVGKSWYAQALEYLKATLGGLSFFKTEMGFAVEDLLMQAPSGLVVLLLLASAVLLIMEPRLREWAGTSGREMNTSYLRGFRLPDVFVWVTILSLLGSFVKSDIKWIQVVSVNLLNVCVL
ncbi:MAG: DUF2232 domain-containing protein, partial [Bdellovibrionales bacterium]|nr:DUF2232 domain-containing protein [Bdellovibrionales bacterium]